LNDRLDESVVRACQQDDKAAYAVLVKRHYRHVFALCLGVLGNVHDAWILRIARNLCFDFLRRQKRKKVLSAKQLMRPGQRTGENHVLQQAIRRLPQELRVPLTMYYFDGKNAKTIAEKLDISHSGACQKIREARKQLHELLKERENHEK
jgi:RNA polymerase sigma-70 factor (ECF subfamily)